MASRRSTSSVLPLDRSRAVVKPDSRSSLAFFAAVRSARFDDSVILRSRRAWDRRPPVHPLCLREEGRFGPSPQGRLWRGAAGVGAPTFILSDPAQFPPSGPAL